MANRLLRELGNPQTPIDPTAIAQTLNCLVSYEDMEGLAEGYTAKVRKKDGSYHYVIFVATDYDVRFTEEILKRKQRYTIAHEIGHIIMHHSYDWGTIDPESALYNRLEVEANWFASRLLIPDYVFENVNDLDPDVLADKCLVNYSSAKKRLEKLDIRISQSLIKEASESFIWGEPEEIEDSGASNPIIEYEAWQFEVAAALNIEMIICTQCGQVHSRGLIEIFPVCNQCDAIIDIEPIQSVGDPEPIPDKPIDIPQKKIEIPSHPRNEEQWNRNMKQLDKLRRIYGYD
jgi:hypothetical protein